MKYITVIEVICDAADEENAYHTAGEFLKGNEDHGISITCRTAPLQVR